MQTPDMLKSRRMFTRRFVFSAEAGGGWWDARKATNPQLREASICYELDRPDGEGNGSADVAALTFQQLREGSAERAAPGSGHRMNSGMARQ